MNRHIKGRQRDTLYSGLDLTDVSPISHMPAAYVPRLVDACCGSFSLGCVMRVFIRVHLQEEPFRTLVCHIKDGRMAGATSSSRP